MPPPTRRDFLRWLVYTTAAVNLGFIDDVFGGNNKKEKTREDEFKDIEIVPPEENILKRDRYAQPEPYTVTENDVKKRKLNLGDIVWRYDVSRKETIRLNGGIDDPLRAGQIIKIPKKLMKRGEITYTGKPTISYDNFERISHRWRRDMDTRYAYQRCLKEEIDPRLAMLILWYESHFGTDKSWVGWDRKTDRAKEYPRKGANNPAGIRGRKGFASYKSLNGGVNALIKQLKRYADRGFTVQSMLNRYSPPFENKTERYIGFIEDGYCKGNPTASKQIPKEIVGYLIADSRRYNGTASLNEESKAA